MGNFNRGDRSGGARSFGRRDDRGSRPPMQMHKATCDKCGKECEVPFRPTGDKPVFCSNCFERSGGGESRPRFDGGGRFDRKPSFDRRPSFDRGAGGDRGGRSDAGAGLGQVKTELVGLNAKLDKIIGLLSAGAPVVKTEPKKEVSIKEALRQAQGEPIAKATKPAKKTIKKATKKTTKK